jgi:hypothetical protein
MSPLSGLKVVARSLYYAPSACPGNRGKHIVTKREQPELDSPRAVAFKMLSPIKVSSSLSCRMSTARAQPFPFPWTTGSPRANLSEQQSRALPAWYRPWLAGLGAGFAQSDVSHVLAVIRGLDILCLAPNAPGMFLTSSFHDRS